MLETNRILEAATYDFSGKNILITGASGGIGYAIAKKLIASGAQVFTNSRRNISSISEKHVHFSGDLSNEAILEEWVEQLPKIDGVVYSAGILDSSPIRFAKKEKMMKTWDINFFAAVNLSALLIKKKRLNSYGSFVFISSISAKHPYIGGSMYTASKAALETYSKVLALELKSKYIRSNCLAPAMVKTEMYERGIEKGSKEFMEEHVNKYPFGAGEPEDLAQAACFLLSDAARWINGVTITLDGGFLLQGS
jgi:NAD(P)-dependent dehydrogenase (short-subunit alcohol dehydrogenase family)